jgi:hypothetical protein
MFPDHQLMEESNETDDGHRSPSKKGVLSHNMSLSPTNMLVAPQKFQTVAQSPTNMLVAPQKFQTVAQSTRKDMQPPESKFASSPINIDRTQLKKLVIN